MTRPLVASANAEPRRRSTVGNDAIEQPPRWCATIFGLMLLALAGAGPLPAAADALPPGVKSISVGVSHACAVNGHSASKGITREVFAPPATVCQ